MWRAAATETMSGQVRSSRRARAREWPRARAATAAAAQERCWRAAASREREGRGGVRRPRALREDRRMEAGAGVVGSDIPGPELAGAGDVGSASAGAAFPGDGVEGSGPWGAVRRCRRRGQRRCAVCLFGGGGASGVTGAGSTVGLVPVPEPPTPAPRRGRARRAGAVASASGRGDETPVEPQVSGCSNPMSRVPPPGSPSTWTRSSRSPLRPAGSDRKVPSASA